MMTLANSPSAAIVMPCLVDELDTGRLHLSVAEAKAGLPVLTHLEIDRERVGFIRTANTGIRAVLRPGIEFVCLLNADAMPVCDGWLTRMIEAIEQDDRTGFAGPSIACGTWPQKGGVPGMPPGVEVVQRINFSCTVVRRAVFDAIGLFDERYVHYGGDYAFLHIAQEQGWQAVWVRDVYVWHKWSDNRFPEWIASDRLLFYSEWKRDGTRV